MNKQNQDESQNFGLKIWSCRGSFLFILVLCCAFISPAFSESTKDTTNLLPEFNVTPISIPDEPVTAISLTLQKTEKNQAPVVPLESIQINLTDPDGTKQDVVLCGALNFTQEIKPGYPFYLIKRNKPVFFLVDNLTQGGCGGGTGGGGGSGGATNKAFSPVGEWKIEITGDSNLTPFTGTFTV